MMIITKSGIATNVPAHSSYEVKLNTQVKTANRNGIGTLKRETLPDKWSIDNEWEFSKPEDFYAWFNYLAGLTRIDFDVSFPAPTGNIEHAVFYISPISAKMINYSRGNGGWWKNLKCSFLEV